VLLVMRIKFFFLFFSPLLTDDKEM
jgi:hypothetical protein